MEILDLNSPELQEMIQILDRVENRLGELVVKVAEKRWLSPQAVCDELGISKRTLARYRDELDLVHSRIGDKVFYKKSSLEEFLESYSVIGF